MRLCMFAVVVALAASPAFAHGPQIQITNDNDKIVTRQILKDGPYSASLTAPKSVYVMPLLELGGVWYTRPNQDLNPITMLPQYYSGPGLTYGYDLVDGGPQAFATGSVLSMSFLDGLKLWDGAAFSSAGPTELKAFRGSNVNIASPPENFAGTRGGPTDLVSLNPVLENYGSEGVEVHNTVRFALLGDGTSPTSSSPNGVFLAKLEISSRQEGLASSDPFYFVLHKNASRAAIDAAVESLGIDAALVQYVPEPSSLAAFVAAAMCVAVARWRRLKFLS